MEAWKDLWKGYEAEFGGKDWRDALGAQRSQDSH